MATAPETDNRLNLLLADADEGRPVLGDGLPDETTRRGKKPKKAQGGDDTHDWRQTDADPNDLQKQRWAVIAPEGAQGSKMLDAIQELVQLREAEQGAPVERYRMPPGLDAVQAKDWLIEECWKESKATIEQPLYLLLLGDLHQISAESQHALANEALVGRIHFADPDGKTDLRGYAAYAEKVARFAREGTPDSSPDMLFFVADDGTSATRAGEVKLIDPSLAAAQEGRANSQFHAADVRKLSAETADDLLSAGDGARPSVLLSVSHGLGPPRRGFASEEEQQRRQGALVFGRGEMLEAEQMKGQRFLPGGLWFYLACFGAGTPGTSAYHAWLLDLAKENAFGGDVEAVLRSLPGPDQRPFVAALPQAALANPHGPLAVVGHLDLAWTYSFTGAKNRAESRKSRIFSALEVMVRGSRAGVALNKLLETYRETNDRLLQIHQRAKDARAAGQPDPTDPLEWGHLWMQRNDLRGYVLLGDPAVRLPLSQFALRRPAPPSVPEVRTARASPQAPHSASAAPPDPAAEPVQVRPSVKAEAVEALWQGDESPRDIAARAGVSVKELWAWFDAYRAGGRARLED